MPRSVNVMMLALYFMILVFPAINLVGAQSYIYHDRIIHVHKKGNDNESCLTGQEIKQAKSDHCCKTLEYVADNLRNSRSRNVTIILESKIQLSSAVNFSNHELLTVQGRSKYDTVKLSCKCYKTNNIGMSFIRIKVSNFTIMHCCGIVNNYTASLFIRNSSDVIIEGSQIHNNRYSGLIVVNPSGMITIRKCKFSENGEKSGNVSSTGAGLHIEFSQHSLTTAAIDISDCEFIHNMSPGQKRNGSDTSLPLNVTNQRKWKRQSIGGGMAIVLY